MKLNRNEFLFFISGLLSLVGLGFLLPKSWKTTSVSDSASVSDSMPQISEEKYRQMVYRDKDEKDGNNNIIFRVNRKQKTVCAYQESTGEMIWESRGEDRFIIPGTAFPIDFSPEGELWVANVGRKRLERLNPKTGEFIASWEPSVPFGGCCNPVRFAALSQGRFITMEKGTRQACIYLPSGELEQIICPELSNQEANYYLCHDDKTVYLYDSGITTEWEILYDNTKGNV